MIIYIFFMITFFYTSLHAQTVHVFGDSHALHCFANEKLSGSYVYTHISPLSIPVEIHWLGPKTMHSFGRDGLNALDIRQPKETDIVNKVVISKIGKPVQEHDILIFTLGEIDVRNHICRQRDLRNREIPEIINTLVTNYCKTINLNRALYEHLTCIVMEIIPPFDESISAGETEIYGSLPDRIAITRLINHRLQEACRENNYIFLRTHDLYALESGILNPALSDSGCHVGFVHNNLIRRRLFDTLVSLGCIQ